MTAPSATQLGASKSRSQTPVCEQAALDQSGPFRQPSQGGRFPSGIGLRSTSFRGLVGETARQGERKGARCEREGNGGVLAGLLIRWLGINTSLPPRDLPKAQSLQEEDGTFAPI